MADYPTNIADLTQEIYNTILAEILTLKSTIDTKNTKIDNLQADKDKLQAKVEELQADKTRLQAKIDELKGGTDNSDNFSKELAKCERRGSQYQTIINRKNEDIRRLREKIRRVRQEAPPEEGWNV